MGDLLLGHLVFALFTLFASAGGFAIARHFRGARAAFVTACAILTFFAVLYGALLALLTPYLTGELG